MSWLFQLSGDLALLRSSVKRFARKHSAPRAAAIDRNNELPRELWPKLGALGLLSISVEEKFAGAALGYHAHVLAMEDRSRASASVGLSYGAHSNLCVDQIRRNGRVEQKRKYPPKLISGKHVGALALSEAGAGSGVVSMRLRANLQGDHYNLDGTKMWITNGPDADTLVVCTKTNTRHHRLYRRKHFQWAPRISQARHAGHHARVPGCRAALCARTQTIRPVHRRISTQARQARRHDDRHQRRAQLCLRRSASLRCRACGAWRCGGCDFCMQPNKPAGWHYKSSSAWAGWDT